ncbi:MAG: MobF family relaxase [Ilumatobacter fluminis]|uniref:MobF family relaxase n=1 Tax=Ilumatobacter fluminis TaxID=467091 RepID=UPI0032EB7D74
MSLWKLRVGAESYYLAQIASGLDEYYTGAGEAPGQWSGSGAASLGLDGQVAGEDLRAVLAGLAPGTALTPNGTTLASHARRVPGFDLTFSVPKSVSVLWALGDPIVQAEVVASCEAALRGSMAWLEHEACFVRRGTNNRQARVDPAEFGTRRMVAEGFVAAQFPHRTSRMGDPHLHWHVLVANTARGIDGRWTALDGTALYKAQRPVGVLFQAEMRRELSQRLGIEWGPMHNDSAEIAGIPGRLLREFSQRADQIAEWLDVTGQSGSGASKTAALETRTSKQLLADFAVLEVEWRERAEALGWGPAQLDSLLASGAIAAAANAGGERWTIQEPVWRAGASTVVEREAGFEEWIDWLLTERVTEKSGTFTRFDLTQSVASALPVGTPIGEVERVVARALGSPSVVQIGDHWSDRPLLEAPGRSVGDDRELLYTAQSLLTVERKLLNQLADSVGTGTGIMPVDAVAAATTASTLGDDQAAAVLGITSAGDQVAVMIGRAGTGKTHTLGTIRSIYETAGWDVIGLAPSARAARELADGAGIGSTTLARHLVEQRTITATTLVVVDEAGMAGTRELAAIIDQAVATGGKVLLVGDDRQLPEVAHGGAFRAAQATLGDRVVELTVNRRQRHEWERQALDQLRAGNVAAAFAAYRDHGRVILADDPADIHGIALADWLGTRSTGADVLMLAGLRSEVRLLNRHARTLLTEQGLLDTTGEVEFAGRNYTVGDEVVLRRNHPHQHLTSGEPFAVDNGMRGAVTSVGADHMTLRITTGQEVVLERSYLERGWVDHAYANTIHTVQGATADDVMLVGPAGLYLESTYVALSRARQRTRIYLTVNQAAEINEAHRTGIPLPTETERDPVDELLTRINRSAAKDLVTVDDPHAGHIAMIATTVPAPELWARARHAATAEQTCGADNPTALRTALDTAIECRTHLAEGRRVRAIDRDNVGHVITIDDTAGHCLIHFENTDGRTATRTLDWNELVVIDRPEPVTLTPTAQATLATRRAAVETAEQTWADALAAHGMVPGDADLYRRATHTALDQAANQLRADQPEWLTAWLGHRPNTPAAATVWDDAVTQIAHHRTLHDIPSNEPGLGHHPDNPEAAERRQTLMMRLLEDRLWLADHPTPTTPPLAHRTPASLIDRQTELEQLLSTAPVDQRNFIDRITHSQLDPIEMHEYLTAAMTEQSARRDWILTNWPHLIELEQVTTLIAAQAPLAHWPTAQPSEVQQALVMLRSLAPDVETRETRTLAQIDEAERAADPVHQLEARHRHLRALAARARGDELKAVEAELAKATDQLRTARQAKRVDRTFDRYRKTQWDHARDARINTLTADTLAGQPQWLIDELSKLRRSGQLSALTPDALRTQVVRTAIALDGGNRAPAAATPTIEPAPT